MVNNLLFRQNTNTKCTIGGFVPKDVAIIYSKCT